MTRPPAPDHDRPHAAARRIADQLVGVLAGMILGVGVCLDLAPDAWAPTPRPAPHADPRTGPRGMTPDGVSPVPSPDVEGLAGASQPPPASPVATPSPSATGTRPAPTATPRTANPPRHSITGTATWFRSSAGVSAAGPALRAAVGPGWRGTRVTVCAASCVRTVLGDWMRADRLVDLRAPLFAAICGPLSKGVCRVSVRW